MFEHLNAFIGYDDVKVKVDKICRNTFFGGFLIGEVKIKQSNSFVKEIWALRIPSSMKFRLEDYYMSCSNRCGYIY